MAYQVTMRNLESVANSINKALGHGHTEIYTGRGNDQVSNAGFVYVSRESGRARFLMVAKGGGASNITVPGTKSQAWEQGQCYLDGLRAGMALSK